jgi:hypothetical protein
MSSASTVSPSARPTVKPGTTLREDARAAADAVDEARLWDRLAQMAQIGAIPGNGVNRPALSADDITARALLLSWAAARGYGVSVDDIGNLFLRRAGSEPDAAPVMTGSHMDSQPKGGRFDGIYGVMAGLEALEAMDAAGVRTRRPVDVVAWTNEYGPNKTRVFSTTIGHNNETVSDPRYLDIVTRGVLWASGHLGRDGKPETGYGPGGK